MFSTILLTALLIIVLLFTLTLLLHIVVLRVPYIPTSRNVCREMVRLADLKGSETVLDLGAGDARLLITAKAQAPGISASGCELVPTVWLLGTIRTLLSGKNVALRLSSAEKENVSHADVIFLYLMPRLMQTLESKFDAQLRPGTRVISNTFKFPGRQPVKEVKVKTMFGWKKVYLYVW